MNMIMLVGECGAGKRGLIRALSGNVLCPRRAMSVEFVGPFILTPGEFLENRTFYHALTTASAGAGIILFLQNATRRTCLIPPGFAAMFPKTVCGVVTHADEINANPAMAERFLAMAGVGRSIVTSTASGAGLPELRQLCGI